MKHAAKKASSQNKNLIRHTSPISKANLLVFALIFSAIGSYIIYQTFAASGTKVWDSQADFNSGSLSNTQALSNGTVTLATSSMRGAGIPQACTGISISPGQNIQTFVDANPAGTTFCIKTGLYRIASAILPKANDIFIGEVGTVLNGSQDISSRFSASGSYWTATGITQNRDNITYPSSGPDDPVCRNGVDACFWLNDIYVNDFPLTRVDSLSAMGSGKIFYEQSSGKVYIGDNPSGKKIEVGVTTRAFDAGSGTNGAGVTVKGFIVEKFASPAQSSAISGGDDWTVDNNDVRYNHATGIKIGPGSYARNNHIYYNGQMGMSGSGSYLNQTPTNPIWVINNEINNNEYAQTACWEGGGSKFLWTTNLTYRGNYVHNHQYCPGLWTDYDNIYSVYEDNLIEDSGGPGIDHEASFDAIIRNNVVRRTGDKLDTQWVNGSGILVQASRNVQVYGNTVEDNSHGIGVTSTDRGANDRLGPHEVRNLDVHDNTIRVTKIASDGYRGTGSGLVGGPVDIFTNRNNRFYNNHYTICSDTYFGWLKPDGSAYGYITKDQWVAAGNDTTGTFNVTCPAPSAPSPPASTYNPTGTITLKYDAGSTSDWTTITPTETKPVGTNITYQYSSSADNSSWSTITSDINAVPDNRYFQVIASLTTTNTNVSPTIDKISLNFIDPASGDTQPPTAPGNLVVTNTAQTQMKLNWSPATDNVGIGYYTLWRDSTWLGMVDANTTSFTYGNGSVSTDNTALTCGTTYNLRMAAYDTSWNISTQVSINSTTSNCGSVPGDANGDGHVSQGDLTILAANFGTSASFCDFNHDGSVNFLDVSIVLSNFGK